MISKVRKEIRKVLREELCLFYDDERKYGRRIKVWCRRYGKLKGKKKLSSYMDVMKRIFKIDKEEFDILVYIVYMKDWRSDKEIERELIIKIYGKEM